MSRTRDPSREFAFVFAVIAAAIALAPLVHGGSPRFIALGVAIILLVVGLFAPRIVSVPARAWLALAAFLNRTVSTVILAVIYIVVITPTGLYRRFSKKDPLERAFDPTVSTYWADREEPSPRAETLPRQY
jgi:hypothetical protein